MRSGWLVRGLMAVVVAGLGGTSAQAQVDLARRFEPRAYVSEGRRVPVRASPSALLVKAAPSTDVSSLARAVELAATRLDKTHAPVLVEGARRVRDHGLFVVELGGALPRATLTAWAALVSQQDGVEAVYPVLTRETGRAFADDHLVVTAARGQLGRVLPAVLKKTGGKLLRKSLIPDTAVVLVGAVFSRDAVEASARLGGLDGVISAEPELYREYELTATVDDPMHANQWHLSRPGPNQPVPGVGEIFVHGAWDVTKGAANVVVAVFDSGIDVDHEDLAANMVAGFDPSAGDEDPRAECSASSDGRGASATCPQDQPYKESHGTAVSGVVAARGDNNLGVSGVCPQCSIMPVRLLGDQVGSGLSTAEAFTRAVNMGAWVINNSWGPGRSRYFPMSASERGAFDHARTTGRGGKGTVIVFAAGNSRANVASDPYASHPFTVAVAASSNLDDWANYSNYGKEIDVAAPSLGGTISEDNHGLLTADVTGDDGYDPSAYTPDFSGTSAASPVVAGLAGLILAASPDLTAEQVRLVLTRSADKIRADKIDWMDIFGQDINMVFAYDDTGHSIGFGYGRVNATAALRLAADPGLHGAPCSAVGCLLCGDNNRCEVACTTQADCVDGTVCREGACKLPGVGSGDVGAPCTADCAHCTTTLDTEISEASICTMECRADLDCPTGFDCRIIDETGLGICAVGGRSAGARDSWTNCRSDLYRVSLVGLNDAGEAFCSDICFNDDPGSCPYQFHCSGARCTCTDPAQANNCRHYTCVEAVPGNTNWDTPLCFPDPTFGTQCTSNLNCPPGDYCGPDGLCRPDDRTGCSVCQQCDLDEDCGVDSICFRVSFNQPGRCSRGCQVDDNCPGDSVCRQVQRRSGPVTVCLSPSDNPATVCESGYSCTVACRDDVACGAGEVCENATCVPAPVTPDAGPPVTTPPPEEEKKPLIPTPGNCACAAATGNGMAWAALLLGLAGLVLRRRRS